MAGNDVGQNDYDDRLAGFQGYLLLNGADDNGADSDIGNGGGEGEGSGSPTGLRFMTRPFGRSPQFPRQPYPSQPISVPIRMWAAKTDRRFADVTSSVHYDADSGVTYAAYLPTGMGMEIRASGVFHLNSIPQSLIIALYDGGSLSHVVLGFDDSHTFFEGDCQVYNFIVTSAIDDAISYSCTIRPYGVYSTLI